MVKTMPHQTNRFSVLETSTVGSTKDMLTPQSPVTTEPKTEPVVPKHPTPQLAETLLLVQSATLQRGTDIPLCLNTIDSNTPMSVESLIDSGATRMFINIEFVRSKNIWTHRLPRAIPVYNVDGTPNEVGHITKVVDLIVQSKDHSEWATFHVMGISRTTIILGHTWLMEHNPEVDWCMGEISMTRCPMSCRLKATEEMDRPNRITADMTRKQQKTHLHQWVHVEEVPESESTHMEAEPSPGFARLDPDELDEDNRLLIQFVGTRSEEIRATQTISQKLAEAAGGTSSTHFEDIVPKPYQEFRDVFAKESFDELPDQKQWDHAIELVPDTRNFSTKVYPLAPVEQKQLDEFLDENLKSQRIRLSKSPMASLVFIKKKDSSLCLVQDYWKLNVVTVKNAYPLPLIPYILNKVSEAKAKYFTKLDVCWGYNNISKKETKGHLLDEPRPFRTSGHVLWPHKQSGHVPDDDER